MPFINGKFYMNPAYGRAVEDTRRAGASLSQNTGRHGQGDSEFHDDQDGHWVTINGNHVLIQDSGAERPQAQTQKSSTRPAAHGNARPGTKAARIIFNETSGLRPSSGSAEDLHDARVALAHTLSNGESMSRSPATVTDILTPAAARAILTDAAAKAAWADSQDAVREAATSADDTNGAVNFFLDHPGVSRPRWASDDRETSHYGTFMNAAGEGDVPRGAQVTIRTYSLRRRY
jgi:hypothetical protein